MQILSELRGQYLFGAVVVVVSFWVVVGITVVVVMSDVVRAVDAMAFVMLVAVDSFLG